MSIRVCKVHDIVLVTSLPMQRSHHTFSFGHFCPKLVSWECNYVGSYTPWKNYQGPSRRSKIWCLCLAWDVNPWEQLHCRPLYHLRQRGLLATLPTEVTPHLNGTSIRSYTPSQWNLHVAWVLFTKTTCQHVCARCMIWFVSETIFPMQRSHDTFSFRRFCPKLSWIVPAQMGPIITEKGRIFAQQSPFCRENVMRFFLVVVIWNRNGGKYRCCWNNRSLQLLAWHLPTGNR